MDARTIEINTCKLNLNAEKDALIKRKETLENMISNSTQWLEQNEKPEMKLDIDKVILPTDQWSDQCINQVSIAAATTDTLLELDEYFEDELISLQQYLKQIGKLAREQFHNIALSKEIQRLQTEAQKRKSVDNNIQNVN